MHLGFILFATFAVYFYRDIWPLCTFTLTPADINEGPFVWARIAVLTVAAIVVPLFVPRQYVPVDPKVNAHFFLFLVSFKSKRIVLEPPGDTQRRTNLFPSLFSGLYIYGLYPILCMETSTSSI